MGTLFPKHVKTLQMYGLMVDSISSIENEGMKEFNSKCFIDLLIEQDGDITMDLEKIAYCFMEADNRNEIDGYYINHEGEIKMLKDNQTVAITFEELRGFGYTLSDIVKVLEMYQLQINLLSIANLNDFNGRFNDEFLDLQFDINQKMLKDLDVISACLINADNREWLD